MRHVETSAPRVRLNQHTFYRDTHKRLGTIYVYAVLDAFCPLAFVKVYTSKMPITAANPHYDRAPHL